MHTRAHSRRLRPRGGLTTSLLVAAAMALGLAAPPATAAVTGRPAGVVVPPPPDSVTLALPCGPADASVDRPWSAYINTVPRGFMEIQLDGTLVDSFDNSYFEHEESGVAEIPARAPGSYPVTLIVPGYDGAADEVVATTTYTVPCPDPALTLDPRRVAARPGRGTTLASGRYFTPGASIRLHVDGAEQADGIPVRPDGTWTTRATIADLTECVRHEVMAEEVPAPVILFQPAAAPAPLTATATLRVTCPTLAATPGSFDVADQPLSVALTGTGFDANADVAVQVAAGDPLRATTDKGGRFVTTVEVTGLPCGPAAVRARQVVVPVFSTRVPKGGFVAQPQATTRLTVTCPPRSTVTPDPPPTVTPDLPPVPPTPTPTPTPTLVATPGVVATGTTVTAQGAGFAPGSRVTLRWALPRGQVAPGGATVVADAAGALRAVVLVLPGDRTGPRQLDAVVAAGAAAASSGSLLVVPGPLQPSSHGLIFRA